MKITRLHSENFKRIQAVDIAPDGNVITITGKNGAGKSSVLDGIIAALGGKSAAPDKPIRAGEEKAVVCVETDTYTVTRKFTAAGSYLQITTAEGAKISSPQKLLDEIVGSISFDPLSFIDKPAKQQRQTLLDLIGVDTEVYDEKLKELSDARNQAMADKRAAKAILDNLTFTPGVPELEVSVSDLSRDLAEANQYNAALQGKIDTLQRQRETLESLNRQIAELEHARDKSLAIIDEMEAAAGDADFKDLDGITEQIQSAESTNRAIRANREYQAAAKRVESLGEAANTLHHKIKAVEANKANAFSEVEMPVVGLSVDETGVLLDGIPLAQANHAKRLEVSMAIAMRMNPKLRVLLINGNGLDASTLAHVAKMADAEGFQVWQEVMDESGDVGVYIEDGAVKAIDGKVSEEITDEAAA